LLSICQQIKVCAFTSSHDIILLLNDKQQKVKSMSNINHDEAINRIKISFEVDNKTKTLSNDEKFRLIEAMRFALSEFSESCDENSEHSCDTLCELLDFVDVCIA